MPLSVVVVFPATNRVLCFPTPEAGVKRICGTLSSCYVLSNNGRVFTVTPTGLKQVPFPHAVADIACGPSHTLLLTDHGRFPVYALGDNSFGQLGVADKRGAKTPAPVVALAGKQVCGVFAGAKHSAVSTTSGVVVWGGTPYPEPVAVQQFPSLAFRGGMVLQMAMGVDGWAAVTGSGALYTFDYADGDSPEKMDGVMWRYQCVQVVCDDVGFYALTKCGRVFAWGAVPAAVLASGRGPVERGKLTTCASPRLVCPGDDTWHALSMLRLSAAPPSDGVSVPGSLALVSSGLRPHIFNSLIRPALRDELARFWVAALASTASYITLMGAPDPFLGRPWTPGCTNLVSKSVVEGADSLVAIDAAITDALQHQCNLGLQQSLTVLHDAVAGGDEATAVAAGADVVFTVEGTRLWAHRTLVASRSSVLAQAIAQAAPIDVDTKAPVFQSAHDVLFSSQQDTSGDATSQPLTTPPVPDVPQDAVTPAWARRGRDHTVPLYDPRSVLEVSLDSVPVTLAQFQVARQFMYSGIISNAAVGDVDVDAVARTLGISALFDAPRSPSLPWTARACAGMGAVLFDAARVECTLSDAALTEYGPGVSAEAAEDDDAEETKAEAGDGDVDAAAASVPAAPLDPPPRVPGGGDLLGDTSPTTAASTSTPTPTPTAANPALASILATNAKTSLRRLGSAKLVEAIGGDDSGDAVRTALGRLVRTCIDVVAKGRDLPRGHGLAKLCELLVPVADDLPRGVVDDSSSVATSTTAGGGGSSVGRAGRRTKNRRSRTRHQSRQQAVALHGAMFAAMDTALKLQRGAAVLSGDIGLPVSDVARPIPVSRWLIASRALTLLEPSTPTASLSAAAAWELFRFLATATVTTSVETGLELLGFTATHRCDPHFLRMVEQQMLMRDVDPVTAPAVAAKAGAHAPRLALFCRLVEASHDINTAVQSLSHSDDHVSDKDRHRQQSAAARVPPASSSSLTGAATAGAGAGAGAGTGGGGGAASTKPIPPPALPPTPWASVLRPASSSPTHHGDENQTDEPHAQQDI